MATTLNSSNELSSDTVCMLFTDIEGSTNLVAKYGDAYPYMLYRHFELIRQAIKKHDGTELRSVGDEVFALFRGSYDGVQAAIDAQFAIKDEPWPHRAELKVRMGLHKGTVQHRGDDIVGIEVHRAARIGSVARGGQIVISGPVNDEIKDRAFHPRLKIRELGLHRLKDLRYPEFLYDLVIPGLPSQFGQVASIARTNLSHEQSPFFGREEELLTIKDAILRQGHRLVSLVGSGGAGKTSIALAVGHDLIDLFARGTFIVQFADVNSSDLVASVIAQTLGIQELPGVSVIDSIKDSLRDDHILLILDTFEHVVFSINIVLEILAACPKLIVIITSRRRLGVSAEHMVSIGPLGIPADGADYVQITQSPSVQLFVQLAQRERRDFELNTDNAQMVSTICRRLDGLPLAIRLAASQFGALALGELAEQLLNHVTDLRARSGNVSSRHRTLRLTIDWSDSLLEEGERRAFQVLSVFAGGFSIDAAAFVLRESKDFAGPSGVLASLSSQSLLHETKSLGRARLHMLDTVREFATEGLERSGRAALCRERHATFFTNLAAESAPHVMSVDQREHVEVLFQESANIRGALEWLLRQPSAAETARMLESLKWFWISRGLASEAHRWTDLAVDQVRDTDDLRSRASILDVTGWVRYLSGYVARAATASEESYRLYASLDDHPGMASAGMVAGIAKAVSGNEEEGATLILGSLEFFRSLGDDFGTATALLAIGEGARAGGDEVTAEEHHREALRLLKQMGNTFWQGHLLQNFAHFRLHEGNWGAAAQLASEAMSLGERYDYPMVVNLAVAAISGVAVAAGDAVAGARIIGAVEARLDRKGARFEPTDGADFERIKTQAKRILGEEHYGRLATEGAAASWESVLEICRRYQS